MVKKHAAELEKYRDEHRSILETQEKDAREKMRISEDKAFNDGVRQAELRHSKNGSALSVQVKPYVVKIKDKGIIFDSHSATIGFQYQLLVNGIPCFQPHVTIEQEYSGTEVNEERLKWLTEQAFKVAQLAIQNTNTQDMIKFVDSPLIAEQNI